MHPSDRLSSSLQRGYAWLLAVYPKEFREKYGIPMTQVFRDRCREEFSRRGNRGLLRLSFHTFFDLLRSAAEQHADRLSQDIRFGSRALMKSPGFTAMAVLTLAFGIGANGAVFNALSAALLPLPYHEPDRLALAWEFATNASVAHYADWEKHNQVFEGTASCSWGGVDLTGEERPARLMRGRVATNFFSLLGVNAAAGRTFLPDDNAVAILSHDLWQRRYNSSPKILGEQLILDGEHIEVIGVMPSTFRFPVNESVELWTPMKLATLSAEQREKEQVHVLCRLKPRTTFETAKADLERIAKQFGHTLPDRSSYDGSVEGIRVRPLSWFRQVMWFRGPAILVILQVSVALMLLLACANVSGLLLARVTLRQKEMGIRTELGASRSRLIRQLLTESLLLALMGGVVGLLLAWGMTHLLVQALPSVAELPFNAASINSARTNGRMLGFTLLVTLLTGLVFGLTPAFVGSQAKPEESLRGRWQWRVTFPKQHIHSLLVVIEVAVALVLLTRAALEVQDALRKPEYRPGLVPDNVVTLNVHLPEAVYGTKPEVLDAYTRIVQAVQRVPQIKSVGVAGQLSMFEGLFPFVHGNNLVGIIPEVANGTGAPLARATSFTAVSSTLLSTLRIPLRMGRYFSDQPSEDGIPPAVIMEYLARRLFPNQNPLGKRITIVELPDDFKVPQQFNLAMAQQMKQTATKEGKSYVIVGVTENLWGERFRADVYVPYLQSPGNAFDSMRFMTVVARTTTDGSALTDAVSKAVWQVDKNLPVSQARTLAQDFEQWAGPDRLLRQLLAFFAAASLFLAAIGIYALVTYVVGKRTREIAVRLSIGARPAEIMRSVVIQGAGLIGIGVAFGLLLTLTLPLFFVLIFGIVTLNPQYFTGDLAPERLMFLFVGLLAGTALILVISGLNNLKRESSGNDSRTRPFQAIYRFKKLLGNASKLTFTGVLGGLYFSSALLGLYFFFADSAPMLHPQAFAGGSLVLACVTLTACCLTARKAMRVDTMDALRSD